MSSRSRPVMRIFLSHSSRDKPLIREVQRNMPHHVRAWIDEREIRLGDSLHGSIRSAITSGTDFVVIFIGPEAVRSEWVRQELEWALAHERQLGRTFVLPVILDKSSWGQLPTDFQDRRYLSCTDFSEMGLRDFSRRLADELFALVSAPPTGSSQNPALEEVDLMARRDGVRRLASQIADDQENATPESLLTKERLWFIVSSLEPKRKVELLCLYELQFGRFKGLALTGGMEKAHRLLVDVSLGRDKRWTQHIEWSARPFGHLKDDYGLGDERYDVRDVFLKEISRLGWTERNELFSGMEILNCSFDR